MTVKLARENLQGQRGQQYCYHMVQMLTPPHHTQNIFYKLLKTSFWCSRYSSKTASLTQIKETAWLCFLNVENNLQNTVLNYLYG